MSHEDDSTASLADITREARTALSNIVGYSEILTEDLSSVVPSALPDLDRIRSASRKVLSLVARLEQQLDSARAEAALDPLTGIANRRTFEGRCESLFNAEGDIPMSLVLIDLDHFKDVNDTFGHLAGDDVLKEVVERCRRAVRDSDLLARLAGDEFVLLLPSTPPSEAMRVAERLRRSIVSAPLATRKGPVDLTVSVGVSTRLARDRSIQDLIERADQAMYAAKNDGRDRIATDA